MILTVLWSYSQIQFLIIEDATQVIDAYIDERPLVRLATCLHFFHETKNIICIGGMLVVNDERFVDRALSAGEVRIDINTSTV